jgi:transcriptional regulator with XRE-family HTH domain
MSGDALKVGKRIANAREAYRLNQAQLAANLGVTRAAISQYEQGKITPRAKIIDRLADLFNSDPEWFQHGRGKSPSVLDAPLTLREINVERLTAHIADPCDLANGREWRLPMGMFAKLPLAVHDHMVVIVAPNDAGPIQRGDKVVINTRRHKGKGVALVAYLADLARLEEGPLGGVRIVGYAVGFYRPL